MEDSRESIDEYLKNKIVERGGLQVRKSLLQGFTLSEIIDSMPCVSQQSKVIVVHIPVLMWNVMSSSVSITSVMS